MKALRSLVALSLALFLSSCSLTQQAAPAAADEPAAAQKDSDKPTTTAETKEATPTEEQQQAAAQLIEGASDIDYSPEHIETLQNAATEAPAPTPAGLPAGGLRMGSIIPQEDPASTGDAPPPSANAAERFGLRSPRMPGKLPMGIDGKLKTEQ